MSQTFGEAVGGESSLCLTVLLAVATSRWFICGCSVGHGLLGVPLSAQVAHGHDPFGVVPSGLEHHHRLFHELVSVQMEPSVM